MGGQTSSGGRVFRLVAASMTLLVVAAGCTTAPPQTEVPRGGGDVTPAPQELDAFYDQELSWDDCGANECTTVTVPLSYQEPDGESIEIEVLRVPASDTPVGSLLVNPGGPGGSGVEYAEMAGMLFGARVLESYDVIGFDPRGVGGSAPIRCVDDAFLDRMHGADITVDDAAVEAEIEEMVADFLQACEDNAGPLLGHVSTVDAARDMDIIRAALGEEQLDYLGTSYGTFLGTTYATLFPDRVGRMVLDAALLPTLTGLEMGLGQAEGFERATRAYVESCVDSGGCALGDDVDSALQAIPEFLDSLKQNPLPVDGDVVTELTEGWAFYGIIVAMYDERFWGFLDNALSLAIDEGDGSMLMLLASAYFSREPDGTYTSNMAQAIFAVNCLDRRDPGTDGMSEEELENAYLEVAPTWGRHMAGESLCSRWPVEAQERLTDYSAQGAPPIVVIGTTRDPATPYEWAEGLADLLDSGLLVTFDGDGHSAYGRENDCIDTAVEDFLIDGTVPQDGLTC